MSRRPTFAAVDLGAESGRVVLGRLGDGSVALEEVTRFSNRPVTLPDGLHWDALALFRDSLAGIALAAQRADVQAVGIDSWGVDYGLLDETGRLLGLPYAYRDGRTDGIEAQVASLMAQHRAFEVTGVRSMPFNTVYQLLSEESTAALQTAHSMALMPGLLSYWLCGVQANDRTNASTTGLLDARTGEWARDLIQALGLPGRIFGDLVEPGTVLDTILPVHAQCADLPDKISVIATAGHDTAAAFAGAPIQSPNAAVLSSGTWSLVGMELQAPVPTEQAQLAGLSNERGVFGTTRLLRNVMGLWLLQQCRAAWSDQGSVPEYEELVRLAAADDSEPSLFDPDHASLMHPSDMPGSIGALVRESGQPVPIDRGSMVNAIFVSLACKYRWVIESLERVTSTSIDTIHVVGGGSRNEILCQLTADFTGRRVLAGPSEASALGNVLMQACALGHLSGLEEMRKVSLASSSLASYLPSETRVRLDETYDRFLSVTGLIQDTPLGRDQ